MSVGWSSPTASPTPTFTARSTWTPFQMYTPFRAIRRAASSPSSSGKPSGHLRLLAVHFLFPAITPVIYTGRAMPKLGFISRILGDSNEKEIKRVSELVGEINFLGEEMAALSDEALGAKTVEYRARLEAGETLDDLLPEAFAAVREMAARKMGQRHYDVQLIGGI